MNTDTNATRADTLLEAQFDPRLKAYVYVGGILLCVVTIVGIVLLPFWLVLGFLYINRGS